MRLFLIIYFISFGLVCLAQDRSTLEKRKLSTSKDIAFTNELLNKTTKNKRNTYSKVILLNSKISAREELILTMEEELEYIDQQVLINQEVIFSLESDLKQYKKEYEKMIYYSFLSNDKYNGIMFVLASESFNAAFSRFRYLKEYAKNRKIHIDKIFATKLEISEKIVELEIIKADKKNLFLNKKLENQKLISEKQEFNLLVQNLTKKEKELKRKLREQQKIADKLQREIAKLIEEEARKAALALKNNDKSFLKLTPDEKLLATNFKNNKGILPWPTERGVITRKFGKQPHPVLKGVYIQNDGIDIATTKNAVVRAVFDGVVTKVFAIPGANKIVIVRHGSYFTVYSNLKDVIVSQGDKLTTKQTIGSVFTDLNSGEKSILKFQIWLENKKMNPAIWLAKF